MMQAIATPVRKSQWMTELIGALGFVQRNYYLTKRYFMWELVWLIYTTGNAMSIGFIGVAIDRQSDNNRLTTYLLIGALIWSYLSMLFDILAETVSWERWEGTIEYTFMSPVSRATPRAERPVVASSCSSRCRRCTATASSVAPWCESSTREASTSGHRSKRTDTRVAQ